VVGLFLGSTRAVRHRLSRIQPRTAIPQALHRIRALPREWGPPVLEWLLAPAGSRRRLVRGRRWLRRRLPLLIGGLLVICALVDEVRTSVIQSWLFSRYASRASYVLAPGPSSSIAFPASDAPYDRRTGYAMLSDFQHRLEQAGFRTVEQSRFSPALLRLAKWGVGLPYPEPFPSGLLLEGTSRDTLFDAAPTDVAFHDYEEIPESIVKALLFIENKELDEGSARRNPVIEWGRFLKGVLSYGASRLGLPIPLEGGSTLAIQLEKYRHSPSGRTGSGVEKLRQMLAASVRVYRRGPDTREERRRIILDYLNSMPLAAVPKYGEVQGLGEGLRAWYGIRLQDAMQSLSSDRPTAERAAAFKRVLALLCAVRAPTTYLARDPEALERRVAFYTRRLAEAGVIEADVAAQMGSIRLAETEAAPETTHSPRAIAGKATTAMRVHLQQVLGVPGLYELDRLHLAVQTTLDRDLQDSTETLLADLGDSTFLSAHGLRGKRLLSSGDPRQVVYSVLLFEKTREGNAVRVQADNLPQQLDLNEGMKLELGSTAKLRVLAHYLELVESLYRTGPRVMRTDPITAWAAETLRDSAGIGLPRFLELALERRYSASPWEVFFTGSGIHTFHNFDSTDNRRMLTVREALERSNNLVFIRVMRDLVRYHEARLPYDMDAILSNPDHPDRRALLAMIGDQEALDVLERVEPRYRNVSEAAAIAALLESRARSPRELAILFFAAHPGGTESGLGRWLNDHGGGVEPGPLHRLVAGYGNPALTVSDYAFLLRKHPLEVWCALEAIRHPWSSWEELRSRSDSARQIVVQWLLRPGRAVQRAQDQRLRIWFEQQAFLRMTPAWKRLGFPFERLVPSLATAIGSSADRPAALAELVGILMNDGIRVPVRRIEEITFAEGTPYQTVMAPNEPPGVRVMGPEVARALRGAMAGVVSRGTAVRAAGTLTDSAGSPLPIGGKTGSGDNRFQTFGSGGWIRSSRAINRTATFVFYLGDRYFGVITAFVPGSDADAFVFTSSLPVAVFRLLAPAIQRRLVRSPEAGVARIGSVVDH